MYLDLVINIRTGQFVTSSLNGSSFSLPPFPRRDKINFRIQFVADRNAGGISNPISVVSVAAMDLAMYLGPVGTPQADQTSWTADTVNNWFTGMLDLNTDLLEAAVSAVSPLDLERVLEIQITQGGATQTLQATVVIAQRVFSAGAPSPSTYVPPSALETNLALLLADSDDVDVQHGGGVFTFVLKDAGRPKVWTVASQAAMLALSARKGDTAIRTDTNRIYVLNTADPTTLANWVLLPSDFNYQGAWSNATTYGLNDVTSKAGSLYISLQAGNLNKEPSTQPTWWGTLIAASNIQLANTTPATEAVAASGTVGVGTRAARDDHRHPMPGLATRSAAGFEAAADFQRFGFSEIGGPNGPITASLKVGAWFYIFGTFTTWDNTPAPGVAKVDRYGKIDPFFDPGTGTISPIYFARLCGDGDIVFGSNAKSAWNGGAAAWLHKISSTGAVDGAFTSPASIANTGTDALLSLVTLSGSRIAALSWQTLRLMDITGTTTAFADGDANLHRIATGGPDDPYIMLTTAALAEYDGVLISSGVKLLNPATMAQLASWLVGATAGGGFSGHDILPAADLTYYIVGTSLAYGGTNYKWNGGAEDAKGLIKLLPAGTQDHAFAPIIVMNDAVSAPVPFAIDSLGRVYFGGNILSVNATAVTPNRLYRVDSAGANLVEFDGFDGSVTGMELEDDDHLMIRGSFENYGNLPVWGMVFIDSTGARLLDVVPVADGATRVGVYRDIDVDAGAMVPSTTGGCDTETTEKTTNYIDSDVMVFIGASETSAQFKFNFPDEWDLGLVKVKFLWEPAAGASGGDGVVWGIKALARSDDDAIDTAWGTEVTVADTVHAVGDLHTSAAVALTVGGTPVLGDKTWFKVTRKTADGSDTMTQDAYLLGVQIQYKELVVEPVIW
jgi:hypothetical protein